MSTRGTPAVVALVVLAALAGGGAAGCESCGKAGRAAPVPDKAVFGELASREGLDWAPYFALARAALPAAPAAPALADAAAPALADAAPHALADAAAHAPATASATTPPPAPPPNAPGARVILTAWHRARVWTTSAVGPTLADAVTSAARALALAKPDPAARLEIDVVTAAEPADFAGEVREPLWQLGLRGYVATLGPSHVGWVTPTEMIAYRYFDLGSLRDDTAPLPREPLVGLLTDRASADRTSFPKMDVWRVTTIARVEAPTAADPRRTIPVIRAMPPRPERVTPVELTDAVRAGADYLCRVLDAQGRFEYQYRPVDDRDDRAYSILRHAGATYAILEAYGETPNPLYLGKAQQAIAYMKSRTTRTADGTYLSDAPGEEQQKSGGSGLMMVALAKYVELTGDQTEVATMRDLARYIVKEQYPDGHFRANEDVAREDPSVAGKDLVKEVTYYPGEAVLGLVRLYQVDPQPAWLEAAKKGAAYLIDVRDAKDDEDHQIHDHWLSYALEDLYRLTKNEVYAQHAFKIARAILRKEGKPATVKAPDYVATFYAQGETTPTSTRLEALAADLELSRFMGKDAGWIEPSAMELATFEKSQQFDDDRSYFVARPDKARGGVRESLLVNDVRIDYVQHAMSGWLHFARFLRDPSYAKPK